MSKNNIEIKYRTWHKGIPPQRIKLKIPGWAGDSWGHSNQCKPQPWHCVPFTDGSTYGLELIYPFDTECEVANVNGEITFSGDFSHENSWDTTNPKKPPFSAFAPGHYGFTSSLDIKPPPEYVVRLEPHPRFFTDTVGDCPIAVPGHIHRFWPKIFFIVFKSPLPGQTHIFRKNEPYAQVLIVPEKVSYDLVEMSPVEKDARIRLEKIINANRKQLSKNMWKDHKDNNFDDKYKQVKLIYSRLNHDDKALADYLTNIPTKKASFKPILCGFKK